MTLPEVHQDTDSSVDLKTLLHSELDEANRALKEINLMLEQSRVEVSKLTQRNAAVTAHLQQIRNQLGALPAEEVQQAYDSALDAQQRLFVMRNQLEKLQNDQVHLEKHKKFLEQMQTALEQSQGSASQGRNSALASVEMLVNAQESERQRLSRQMHDGPAQALSNFILQAEIVMRLLDVDPVQARKELENLKLAAFNTFQKVRGFIFELRPMMLDDLGLAPTIRRYAETYKEQSGVDISVTLSGQDRRLEPYIEVMVFRAMQELLAAAVHQNQATLVKIQLDLGDAMVKLSVDDNGRGFDTDALNKESNLGLKLIRERVGMLGGTFTMDSAPGMGSRLSLSIPIQPTS